MTGQPNRDVVEREGDPPEDRENAQPAAPKIDSRRVYRDDGHGCVERVHPSELAWEERYG